MAEGVKYLLLDDRNIIEGFSTAEIVLGKVEKVKGGAGMGSMIHDGDPERPYEMRFDNMQPNVWYDPALRKWRAWYSSFTDCGGKPKGSVPCAHAAQGSIPENTRIGHRIVLIRSSQALQTSQLWFCNLLKTVRGGLRAGQPTRNASPWAVC